MVVRSSVVAAIVKEASVDRESDEGLCVSTSVGSSGGGDLCKVCLLSLSCPWLTEEEAPAEVCDSFCISSLFCTDSVASSLSISTDVCGGDIGEFR